MRLRAVFMAAFIFMTAAGSALANHNAHDHSDNIRSLAAPKLRWSAGSEVNSLGDFAFQGRLILGAVGYNPGVSGGGLTATTDSGVALFRTLKRPPYVRQLSAWRCAAAGDVSIHGDLAFIGAMASEDQDGCLRNGLRILDISHPRRPEEVGFVRVPYGVSTHTVVPEDGKLYVIATGPGDDSVDNPIRGDMTSQMVVIRIVRRDPGRSYVAAKPNLLPHPGCWDVVYFAPRELAACAAENKVILMDASDPPATEVLTTPPAGTVAGAYSLFSVSFSWDGRYLVVTDSRVDCQDGGEDPGAGVYIVDVEDPANPQAVGRWTAPYSPGIDCASRMVTVLPTKDPRRYLALVGNSHRGIRIVDFSEPTRPSEIAHYVPMDTAQTFLPFEEPSSVPIAYWYNGRIYASDLGFHRLPKLRVFKLRSPDFRGLNHFARRYNPQSQIGDFR